LLPNFGEFLKAWTARTEMIQPLISFRQWNLVTRDTFEKRRAWTPDSLGIREISGQTPIQQIQYPLFLDAQSFLFLQKPPAFNSYQQSKTQ
jgi:hypothetical protein